MECEIVWGADPEDVCVTTFGRATVEALDALVQTLLADPRYRPGLRVLLDHRRAEFAHLATNDLRRRADLLERDSERIGNQRVAEVVSRRVDFGLGRMLLTFGEGRTDLEWGLFDDIDEARAWLRESEEHRGMEGRPPSAVARRSRARGINEGGRRPHHYCSKM